MATREAILQEALRLPSCERVKLIEALEESFSQVEFATTEIAAEWSSEIDRRLASYDKSKSPVFTVDQAISHLQQALAMHHVND